MGKGRLREMAGGIKPRRAVSLGGTGKIFVPSHPWRK